MAINIFAMPSSAILLLLSAAFSGSNAFPWPGPEPTEAYKGDEWSPRPTAVPANPADIFKRSSLNVAICGWVGGISSNSAVCRTGSSCIHDLNHKYVGCCTTSGSCTAGVYSSCVDYHNTDWQSVTGVQSNGVYTCPSKLECYQNAYPGGYSQWACGNSSDATSIATSYSGQPSDVLLQMVFTPVTYGPTSASASTTASSTFSTSTTTTSTSSPSATSTAGSTSKSSVSGGIIAAAVILPLCFISLLIAGYFFWWRKRQPTKYIERPSSFTGAFKSGSTPDSNPGSFPAMQLAPPPPPPPEQNQQPFSPDDYVSPLTEGGNMSSINQAVISPQGGYGGIQERLNASVDNPYAMPQQSRFARPSDVGAVSEIEHFSGAYMAAIGGFSPMTPQQAQMAYMQSMHPTQPMQSMPTAPAGSTRAPAPAGPQSYTALETETDVGAYINRARDDSIDAFAALEKETGGISKRKQSTEPFPLYEAKGFRSENVRAEGWVPRELTIKRAPSSPARYQLIDEAPDISDGAPVLHEPGQLRGKNGR